MEGQTYKVVYETSLGEIIRVAPNKFRLLCYGITLTREEIIMYDLGDILTQTNTVNVSEKDPLEDLSWFSGDFGVRHLIRVIQYIKEK